MRLPSTEARSAFMNSNPVDPIANAIQEDIGEGDVTTEFFVPAGLHASAQIIAREKAIIAGTETATEVFHRVDPATRARVIRADSSEVEAGDTIIEIDGLARSILKAERVALNFLQRLSGIATLTRRFVNAADNPSVQILDTRKTTPGLRALEKAAVVAGGGVNHRFGLYDMVLVKDNHLIADSGLSAFAETVRRLRQERPGVRIEVEADRLEQVRAFLEIDEIDVVLLDNMKRTEMREAVALRKNKVKFEASGGITLKNIRQIAATGVDYISVGAITHSAPAINLALEIRNVAP
jgi:nicotinate-nucleotide pyrophosphorylase (carboxylating)